MTEAATPHGVRIFLDDSATPIAAFDPPSVFTLQTEGLADGPHTLRVEAVDECGLKSVRQIPFQVRNGPGIAVAGLSPGDVVSGERSIVVNAYAAGRVEAWEPTRAETPAPIPSWAWVLCLIVAAAGVFYVAREWRPTAAFASSPTYAGWTGATSPAPRPAAPAANRGADLFRVTCANCHQANGEGIPGAFPPLVGDPVVTASDPHEHATIVLFGLSGRVINGARYPGQMPAWGAQLSDDEIAAIMSYERTAWSNAAPTVTTELVASVRASHGATTP